MTSFPPSSTGPPNPPPKRVQTFLSQTIDAPALERLASMARNGDLLVFEQCTFPDGIPWKSASLPGSWTFDSCTFQRNIDVRGADLPGGSLAMFGCSVARRFLAKGLRVQGNLTLTFKVPTGAAGPTISISHARIGGRLALGLGEGRYGSICLRSTSIGIEIRLTGAGAAAAGIHAEGLRCAGDVRLIGIACVPRKNSKRVGSINFGRARIEGELEIERCFAEETDPSEPERVIQATPQLVIQAASIGRHLVVKDSRFGRVSVRTATIGGHAFFRHVRLGPDGPDTREEPACLDLNTATIQGNLHLLLVSFLGWIDLRGRTEGCVFLEGVNGRVPRPAGSRGPVPYVLKMNAGFVGQNLLFDAATLQPEGRKLWTVLNGRIDLGLEVRGDVRIRRSVFAAETAEITDDRHLAPLSFAGATIGGHVQVGLSDQAEVAARTFRTTNDQPPEWWEIHCWQTDGGPAPTRAVTTTSESFHSVYVLGAIDARCQVAGMLAFDMVRIARGWTPLKGSGHGYQIALEISNASIGKGVRFERGNRFNGALVGFGLRTPHILAGQLGSKAASSPRSDPHSKPVDRGNGGHAGVGTEAKEGCPLQLDGPCLLCSSRIDDTIFLERVRFLWRARPNASVALSASEMDDATLNLRSMRVSGSIVLRDCTVGTGIPASEPGAATSAGSDLGMPSWMPSSLRDFNRNERDKQVDDIWGLSREGGNGSPMNPDVLLKARYYWQYSPPIACMATLVQVEGNFDVRGTRFEGSFDAEDAFVRGELNTSSAIVHGALVLRAATVEGTVFADEASGGSPLASVAPKDADEAPGGSPYPSMKWYDTRGLDESDSETAKELRKQRRELLANYRDTPLHPWNSRARLFSGDVDLRNARISQIDLKFPTGEREMPPRRVLLDYAETKSLTLRGRFDTDYDEQTEFSAECLGFSNIEVRDDFQATGRCSDYLGRIRGKAWSGIVQFAFLSASLATAAGVWWCIWVAAGDPAINFSAENGIMALLFWGFFISFSCCSQLRDHLPEQLGVAVRVSVWLLLAVATIELLAAPENSPTTSLPMLELLLREDSGSGMANDLCCALGYVLCAMALLRRFGCRFLLLSYLASFAIILARQGGDPDAVLTINAGGPLTAFGFYVLLCVIRIAIAGRPGSIRSDGEILDWLERSRFSRSTYIAVEDWMRRSGNPAMANAVFLARLHREVDEGLSQSAWSDVDERHPESRITITKALPWWQIPPEWRAAARYWLRWLFSPRIWWSRLLDVLVGHGVHIDRPLHLFVLLWFINWGVFLDPHSVERPLVFVAVREPLAVDAETSKINRDTDREILGMPTGDPPQYVNPWIDDGGRAPDPSELKPENSWSPMHAFWLTTRIQIPLLQLFAEGDWQPASRLIVPQGSSANATTGPPSRNLRNFWGMTYENFAAGMMILNTALLSVIIAAASGYLRRKA